MRIDGIFFFNEKSSLLLKILMMEETLFKNLVYMVQIALFAGISLLIVAWVDKKVWIEKAAQLLYVAMGLAAAWFLASGQIALPETELKEVTKEVRLMFILVALVATSVVALAAFLLRLNNKPKLVNWLNIIIGLASVMLFFMVYNLIK